MDLGDQKQSCTAWACVQASLGLATPSCCCFNKLHWKSGKQVLSSWYCTILATSVMCCVGSSACEVFPIKLFLTATCGCVHLMSSRVEWDCGMSAMNTQLEGNVSHPAHEYVLLCGSVIPL